MTRIHSRLRAVIKAVFATAGGSSLDAAGPVLTDVYEDFLLADDELFAIKLFDLR